MESRSTERVFCRDPAESKGVQVIDRLARGTRNFRVAVGRDDVARVGFNVLVYFDFLVLFVAIVYHFFRQSAAETRPPGWSAQTRLWDLRFKGRTWLLNAMRKVQTLTSVRIESSTICWPVNKRIIFQAVILLYSKFVLMFKYFESSIFWPHNIYKCPTIKVHPFQELPTSKFWHACRIKLRPKNRMVTIICNKSIPNNPRIDFFFTK